jgi:exopolyphosphatase/pppGpp-phosphohydrolase
VRCVEWWDDASARRTLAAGAIILCEAHRRLGVELAVAQGGMREGDLLELFAAAKAAA